MPARLMLLVFLWLQAQPCLAQEPPKPVADRIATRRFPSVFQAWNPADNLRTEERWTTVARHDLVFHSPDFFGLQWANTFQGQATAFQEDSLKTALKRRAELLSQNPNQILIAELRYRDAHRSYLPEDHPWWKRENGKRVVGWEEGGYFLLDFTNDAYRTHLGRQARAIMASGVFDGIMLDWWEDDPDRLALVRELRAQVPPSALILANSNHRTTPETAPYINGYFLECYQSKTPQDWHTIASTLTWAEAHLRQPRINCLETWYQNSREDLNQMRATTTLALTLSDGYCLFADPGPLPTPDHLHNWYPFWEKRLGRPKAPGSKQPDGSILRNFENGVAVYNPPGNTTVTIEFPDLRTSAAGGQKARRFQVEPGDGDLFLTEPE